MSYGFKTTKEKKDATFKLRIKSDDLQQIRIKANECGKSTAEFMISCALDKKLKSKSDQRLIAELSRLGGLQKFLLQKYGTEHMHADEIRRVLIELKNAIKTVSKQ